MSSPIPCIVLQLNGRKHSDTSNKVPISLFKRVCITPPVSWDCQYRVNRQPVNPPPASWTGFYGESGGSAIGKRLYSVLPDHADECGDLTMAAGCRFQYRREMAAPFIYRLKHLNMQCFPDRSAGDLCIIVEAIRRVSSIQNHRLFMDQMSAPGSKIPRHHLTIAM